MALTGCSDRPAPPLALEIDPSATPSESATVQAAAEDWNARVGATLFHLRRPDDECNRVVVRVVAAMPEDHEGAVGLFEQVGCHYRISLLRSRAHDQANATHELGHALELEHSDDVQSVMFWSTRPDASIRSGDVARLRAHWLL